MEVWLIISLVFEILTFVQQQNIYDDRKTNVIWIDSVVVNIYK